MSKVLLVLFLCFNIAFADKLAKVQKSGILKAGVKYDYKPFGFVENGEVKGFDIDLLKYIAKHMGVKLKLVQVTSKTRIPMVKADIIDIAAASMTHKYKRDIGIDFSIDYFYDGQSILVKSNAKERSYKDFVGKKVGAIKGSVSGINFFDKNPKAKIVYFIGYKDALSALDRGEINAITTDYVWCKTKAEDSKGRYKVIGGKFTFEPYGMGVAENQSNFRDMVDDAIESAIKDGSYERLYFKWFKEKPEKLPLFYKQY